MTTGPWPSVLLPLDANPTPPFPAREAFNQSPPHGQLPYLTSRLAERLYLPLDARVYKSQVPEGCRSLS